MLISEVQLKMRNRYDNLSESLKELLLTFIKIEIKKQD